MCKPLSKLISGFPIEPCVNLHFSPSSNNSREGGWPIVSRREIRNILKAATTKHKADLDKASNSQSQRSNVFARQLDSSVAAWLIVALSKKGGPTTASLYLLVQCCWLTSLGRRVSSDEEGSPFSVLSSNLRSIMMVDDVGSFQKCSKLRRGACNSSNNARGQSVGRLGTCLLWSCSLVRSGPSNF